MNSYTIFNWTISLPQKRAHNVIPVIYNSWYAYDFRIDEEKILGLMDRAAELGVELFVIDDGWMPGRDCDSKGLVTGCQIRCGSQMACGSLPSGPTHRE
ncbi:MAG: alpha-galactosidase [Clostridia bacterium]